LATELKNCRRQRQRARWLEENWDWIGNAWEKVTGKAPCLSSPSQSTLSRLLQGVDLWALTEQYHLARKQDINTDQEKKDFNSNDKTDPKAKVILKHYAIDGKSRKGCHSALTGRTEIDVTLFDVATREVLGKRNIPDKRGEAPMARSLLKRVGKTLPKGVITADAGYASPQLISTIVNTGHEYLIGLKGNAGEAYEKCLQMEWDKSAIIHETTDNKHGRKEVRKLRRIVLTGGRAAEFKKYANCTYLFCIETSRSENEKDPVFERRFFIGSRGLQGYTGEYLLGFLREHWLQENGLHWVKDAILGEDDSFRMSNRSSRVLGFFKDLVVSIGYSLLESVQEFIDRFDARPEKYFKQLLKIE